MRPIRNPKIGLVGLMATPWRGDKEGNYLNHSEAMLGLAQKLGFELHIVKGGVYSIDDAQKAASELAAWGADFIILQASSFAAGNFVYPFAALPSRLGIWAVPEGRPSSEGGLPLNSFTTLNLYNSIIRTYLTDYQQPVKWFFGHPGQPLVDDRLAVTVKALRAIVNLQCAKIGLIGGVAPSFDNLIIDERRMRAKLGIELVHIEFDEVLTRARHVDDDRAGMASKQIRSTADKFDTRQEDALEKSGRVYTALEDLADSRGLDAVALSCWPRFQSDYHFAVCTVMGSLNSGGLIAACEGDVTSAAGMLSLHYMTGGDTVTLMDLATVDPADDSILLWHCGPTAPELADEGGVQMQSLWLFDGQAGDSIGLHNNLKLKPGKATVFGFSTDFSQMLVMDGTIDNQKPSYIGSRGWMKSIRMNTQAVSVPEVIQSLMVSGYQHHYPLAYGDLAEAALELGSWLKVSPIAVEPYTSYVK